MVHLPRTAWDPDAQQLTLHSGKSDPRAVPVLGRAAAMLTQRFDTGSEYLFALPRSAPAHATTYLKEACELAGVPVFTSHGLRRLAVNRLLDAGADPKVVSLITGHSVRTLLAIYRRPTADHLRQAAETAGLGSLPQGEVVEFRAQNRGTGSDQ